MSGVEQRWDAYATAIVDIVADLPSRYRNLYRVHAARAGEVGAWPEELAVPVLVLTAWNPGSMRLELEENRRRQAALEAELAVGAGVTRWPAVGWDPSSAYREEGVAVTGLAEHDALAAASRWDQDAIYVWDATAWSIVSSDGASRRVLGWRLERTIVV